MEDRVIDILNNVSTVAIIGCSANKYRTSYHIANYLKENGIQIVPINPNYEEVLGLECYDKIADLPTDLRIDIVDIFRDSQYTAEMVGEIIEWAEKTGQKPLIWTQLAVSSDEAQSLAAEAELEYVANECLMVQHNKITG